MCKVIRLCFNIFHDDIGWLHIGHPTCRIYFSAIANKITMLMGKGQHGLVRTSWPQRFTKILRRNWRSAWATWKDEFVVIKQGKDTGKPSIWWLEINFELRCDQPLGGIYSTIWKCGDSRSYCCFLHRSGTFPVLQLFQANHSHAKVEGHGRSRRAPLGARELGGWSFLVDLDGERRFWGWKNGTIAG